MSLKSYFQKIISYVDHYVMSWVQAAVAALHAEESAAEAA